MSTKYQVDSIRAIIVQRLESDWPQSLVEWDDLWGNGLARRTITPLQAPEPCSAIRLARKCDVPGILPAAFYALSCINLYNKELDPGEFTTITTEPFAWRWTMDAKARWSLLLSTDMLNLMKGKDKIRYRLQIPFKIVRDRSVTVRNGHFHFLFSPTFATYATPVYFLFLFFSFCLLMTSRPLRRHDSTEPIMTLLRFTYAYASL